MIRALNNGTRDALAHWPSAVLLYAAVALPAGLVGYVFQSSLVSAFGRSAALETLSEGFSFTTLFDLSNREGFRILPVVTMSLAFLAIGLPIQTFLTAGMVSALKEHGPWSSRAFFTGAARHVTGFLLMSLLVVAVVLLITVLTVSAAGLLFVESENLSDPGVLLLLTLGIILVAGAVTLGDYARVHLVHDPDMGVFGSIRAAAAFLFRHAGGAAGLLLVLAFASLLPLVGVLLFERAVPLTVGPWLAPLVLVQQAAAFLRAWIRVQAFAAQSSYVRTEYGTLRPGELPHTPSPFLSHGI